jgi:hypothetical protein
MFNTIIGDWFFRIEREIRGSACQEACIKKI